MAINFPSSPSNGTTHTEAGVTWVHDGTSWKSTGYTASSGALGSLTDVTLSSVQTGQLLSYSGSSWGNASLSLNGLSDVDTSTVAPTDGQTLVWDNTAGVWEPGTVSGGGSSLQSRTTAQGQTIPDLSTGGADDINITAAKTFALLKVETSHAAWVTIYTDSTSRTNDSSRTEVQDPAPGSGVLAEVITTGATTQIITPGTFCWNNDSTPSTTTYLKVVNKDPATQQITVTLTYVQLEN